MTQFEDVLETILEEYARRDSEGEFDTWEETDAFVKEKAEVLLAYAKEEPVSEELEEAANSYAKEEYNHKNPATLPDRCRGCYAPLMYAFKAGAQWQKEKMMKDVVLETTVIREMDGDAEDFNEVECAYYENPEIIKVPEWAQNGDKVKVIIVKED